MNFMKKEIHEQTRAITETLEGRLGSESVAELAFGEEARDIFDQTKELKIIACGTSYYAASVARYWFEEFGIKCDVEIRSSVAAFDFDRYQISGGLVEDVLSGVHPL